MIDESTTNPSDPRQFDQLRELARKFDAPFERVEFLYLREWQHLAANARIRQYLDILALRRTRSQLATECRRLSFARRLRSSTRESARTAVDTTCVPAF
jgi:hypothetical protein